MKTYTVPEIVMTIPGLLHSGTAVVSVNNGIPWLYFSDMRTSVERTFLESVDPGGSVWNLVGAERARGCYNGHYLAY